MKNNKPKILEFNVNWNSIKRACLRTIGKEAGNKESSSEWKRKLLICQHSPIRKGVVTWRWDDIPFFSMGHFVRHHVGCTPYVSTSRSDRTDIPREERKQTAPVSMEMDANIQSLIDMASRRLCFQADKTTREYMENLVEEINKYDKDIAWALVPQCIRCGSCVEPFGSCTFYDKFSKNLTPEQQTDIMKRYDAYNEYRSKILSLKKEDK
nr:MAG TPA: Thymidylate synthase thyX [Caudoviricetes sp.]